MSPSRATGPVTAWKPSIAWWTKSPPLRASPISRCRQAKDRNRDARPRHGDAPEGKEGRRLRRAGRLHADLHGEAPAGIDRKSGGEGTGVSVRVDLGGGRN